MEDEQPDPGEDLNFAAMDFREPGNEAAMLAKLRATPRIRSFDLGSKEVTWQTFLAVVQVLKQRPMLKGLSLGIRPMYGRDEFGVGHAVQSKNVVKVLRENLCEGGVRLQLLDVSGSVIGLQNALEVMRLLGSNVFESIESLIFYRCGMCGQILERMLNSVLLHLTKSHKLRHLNLVGSELSADDAMRTAAGFCDWSERLAQVFHVSPNLEHFDLSWSGNIGPELLAPLGELRKCSHLKVLDLSNMRMFLHVPSDLFASYLAGWPELTHLNVARSQLGDVGAQHLTSGFKYHKFLETLNVSDNGITRESALALATAVVHVSTVLQHLILDKNRIGGEGCRQLDSLLLEEARYEGAFSVRDDKLVAEEEESARRLSSPKSASPAGAQDGGSAPAQPQPQQFDNMVDVDQPPVVAEAQPSAAGAASQPFCSRQEPASAAISASSPQSSGSATTEV